MTDRKFPIPDPAEPEPAIAQLARWASKVGGIRSVSISVHYDDGRSVHETVEFFDAAGEEPA